jgi:hypothetical protein
MFWWITLIVAGVLLLLHWGSRNAVWGAATIGLAIGVGIAILYPGSNWWIIGKAVAICTFVGAAIQWLPTRRQRNQSLPLSNPVHVACRAFDIANKAYGTALSVTEPYASRAIQRLRLLIAEHALTKDAVLANGAVSAYDKAVAACGDPSVCAPYTVACLDAHTDAIDSLTTALDKLTDAFTCFTSELSQTGVNIKSARKLYTAAAALYKSDCHLFTTAADAYSNAADCATIDACAGNLQGVRDQFQLMRLEARASNVTGTEQSDAQRKVALFKAEAMEATNLTNALEHKATAAKAKAEELFAKAHAFKAIAGKAIAVDEQE